MLTVRQSMIFAAVATCLPLAPGCVDDGAAVEPEANSAEFESAESSLTFVDPAILFDGCKTTTPDKVHYVTSATGAITSPSPDGGYRYNTADFCGRWVVDFKFSTTAPERVLAGTPYDIPSSASPLGTWPNNAYDCQHLRLLTTIYRKKSTETAFTLLETKSSPGIWTGGTCYAISATASAFASTSGYDTYRVAVGVRLRGAWQQATALAEYPPPK
jgi:hypothetical protein